MSRSGKNGLTYSDAGVDIDAGNLLVEKIKPAVRSTRRPGADGEIGGFGGLFDLKAAGFTDPVLVAANDGVGTKLKIAIDANLPRYGRHRPRRHVRERSGRPGRGAAVLPRLLRHRQARSRAGCVDRRRYRSRLPRGRLRADRRRDRRNAGHAIPTATTIWPVLPWVRPNVGSFSPPAISPRVMSFSASLPPAFTQRFLAGAQDRGPLRPWLGRAGSICRRQGARRSLVNADAHLREAAFEGDPRDPCHQGARPYYRRRLSGKYSARCCRSISLPRSICRRQAVPPVFRGLPRRVAWRPRKCCAPSIAALA